MKTVYELRLENTRLLIQEYGSSIRFAEKIEREPTLISRYAGKNPRRRIGSELARHIEKSLSLAEGWLDTDHAQPSLKVDNGRVSSAITRRIPLLSRVQAGRWSEIVDTFAAENADSYVDVAVRVGGRSFALTVEGDSMISPDGKGIPDGATVIVDPELPALSGKIVVARLESSEEATIKKLIIDGGQMFLSPLNPRFPIIAPDQEWTIVGVVRSVQYEI